MKQAIGCAIIETQLNFPYVVITFDDKGAQLPANLNQKILLFKKDIIAGDF
jgi:hypothetical protein